ncbi:hypothetical protein RHA1_ro00113 [Rhodococcus jostii RHA1]|uniref:Uncharacterized protein n=1 Tax=Rhodococcus jostii (strain RHA1) TaxID=101510 RepID=Q0SKI7_RHOJR|nr:hypothetical protein RHA1_ro00113 [Rhodococcus jostii RHA1]
MTHVTQLLRRGTPTHDPHHGAPGRPAHNVAALCRGAAAPPHAPSDRIHRLCLGGNRNCAGRRRDGIRPRRRRHLRVSARRCSTRRAPDLTVHLADAPFDHHAALAGAEDRKHFT